MPPQQMQFRVWSCLGRALSIFGENFVSFFALAILITAFPEIYDQLFGGDSVNPADFTSFSPGQWVLVVAQWLVEIILLNLLSAVIIFGTTQELRGRHAGIGECVRRGLSLIVPTFLAAIVVAIVTGLGFILFIVPGLICFMIFWLVIPVVVMERPGVFASLKRSAQLTKGVRWRLFGTILVPFAVGSAIQIVVALFIGLGFVFAANQQEPLVGVIVYFLINALFSAFYAVVNAVAYYDIRQSKEGVEIDQIAAVFD